MGAVQVHAFTQQNPFQYRVMHQQLFIGLDADVQISDNRKRIRSLLAINQLMQALLYNRIRLTIYGKIQTANYQV